MYYVFDDGKNKFEGMTREQITAAIAEATGVTPSGLEAFVTQIKEQNAQTGVKLWVGTQNEYNAIQSPDANTLYIVTDPTETSELQSQVDGLETDVDGLITDVSALNARANREGAVIWSYSDGVTTGGTLETYAAFTTAINYYKLISVSIEFDDESYEVLCVLKNPLTTAGYLVFDGSFYQFGRIEADKIFCVRVEYSQRNVNTTAHIGVVSSPFATPVSDYTTAKITQIRGLV